MIDDFTKIEYPLMGKVLETQELISKALSEAERLKKWIESVAYAAHQVLDIFQMHEVGCNSRSPNVSLRNCNCALSPLAYASGWNESQKGDELTKTLGEGS